MAAPRRTTTSLGKRATGMAVDARMSPVIRLLLPEVGAGESAPDQQHPKAVALAVAEPAGDAVELDEAVHGFGAAVVRAGGVEVGQERLPPALQRAAQAGDLGDRAGRERG